VSLATSAEVGAPRPKRVVIADAGPLIALARMGQIALLPQLFGQVTLTTQVANELTQGGMFPDTEALVQALQQPWLVTVDLPPPQLLECADWIHVHQIDMGEASALVLASHAKAQGSAVLLIVDEARGRAAAQHADIAIIGTAGLMLLAKDKGWLQAVKPLLLALQAQGYYLSDRLVQAVLRQAGEAQRPPALEE